MLFRAVLMAAALSVALFFAYGAITGHGMDFAIALLVVAVSAQSVDPAYGTYCGGYWPGIAFYGIVLLFTYPFYRVVRRAKATRRLSKVIVMCRSCRTQFPASDTYCPSCKSPLFDVVQQPPPEKSPKQKKPKHTKRRGSRSGGADPYRTGPQRATEECPQANAPPADAEDPRSMLIPLQENELGPRHDYDNSILRLFPDGSWGVKDNTPLPYSEGIQGPAGEQEVPVMDSTGTHVELTLRKQPWEPLQVVAPDGTHTTLRFEGGTWYEKNAAPYNLLPSHLQEQARQSPRFRAMAQQAGLDPDRL